MDATKSMERKTICKRLCSGLLVIQSIPELIRMMMKRLLLPLVIISFLHTNLKAQLKSDSFFKPSFIKAKMEKVADWQINEFEKGRNRWPKWDWTNGAFYTGVMELATISD